MKHIARFLLLFLVAAGVMAAAETPNGSDGQGGASGAKLPESPVAQVSNHQSWEFAPFVNYGVGVGDRSKYKFLWAGVEGGKVLTPVIHMGLLSGQFQYAANVMPVWEAFTPAPYSVTSTCLTTGGGTIPCNLAYGGGTFHGVSLTPVILRWNFLTRSGRVQPWFQGAGGLIYTTHKFPPNVQSTQTIDGTVYKIDGGTSVWNFSPQGGLGLHYFTRPGRSIDLGVNAVHISSASLGDKNPGVNASIQFQVGYSFWR